MEEKTIKIDVGRIFKSLLRKWYLIIAAAFVAAAVMFALKYDTTQYYSATASVYSAAQGSYSETSQGVYAMQLYSEIITSNKIAERAASIMGSSRVTADDIRSMASASYDEESPVIYITATSDDQSLVVPVANALAQSLVIEAQSITGSQAIQVLDEADTIRILGRGVKKAVGLAGIAGALVVIIIIALVEILSDRVYRVEDAELEGELEVIGIIPAQNIN